MCYSAGYELYLGVLSTKDSVCCENFSLMKLIKLNNVGECHGYKSAIHFLQATFG